MSATIIEFRRSRTPTPAQLIARIHTLLGELEALGHDSRGVPLSLRMQTLEVVEQARDVLLSRAKGRRRRTGRSDESEGEPQPDVDRELLERMYRDLKAGRRPSEA
jgi:hypothetical protein